VEDEMEQLLKMEKSNREFEPELWLRLADEDYVATRLLAYYNFERFAAYHMQQAVEKYLKCFILKHYEIDYGNKVPIIKGCQNIRFKTHDLKQLLECCQQKNVFFKKPDVINFIDTLKNFDEIRYPSPLMIDYEIFSKMDYFAKNVRDLIDIKIVDLISHLQSGPVAGRDMVKTYLKEAFFHKNGLFIEKGKIEIENAKKSRFGARS